MRESGNGALTPVTYAFLQGQIWRRKSTFRLEKKEGFASFHFGVLDGTELVLFT